MSQKQMGSAATPLRLSDEIVMMIVKECFHPELVHVIGPKMDVPIALCQTDHQWARIARSYFMCHYVLVETNRPKLIKFLSTGPFCAVSGTWPSPDRLIFWNTTLDANIQKAFWLPVSNPGLLRCLIRTLMFLDPHADDLFLICESEMGGLAGRFQYCTRFCPA